VQTCIALLRGINVGGKNKIRMADLSAFFERLKYRDIRTYIQSGNVVFRMSNGPSDKIAARIAKAIDDRFGYEVAVIARTAGQMRATVAANPFLKERGIDTDKLHVTFLAREPAPELVSALGGISYPPDRFAVIGHDVFVHCPVRYGGTKLSNAFFERKLKVPATTRNLKTVLTLVEMAG